MEQTSVAGSEALLVSRKWNIKQIARGVCEKIPNKVMDDAMDKLEDKLKPILDKILENADHACVVLDEVKCKEILHPQLQSIVSSFVWSVIVKAAAFVHGAAKTVAEFLKLGGPIDTKIEKKVIEMMDEPLVSPLTDATFTAIGELKEFVINKVENSEKAQVAIAKFEEFQKVVFSIFDEANICDLLKEPLKEFEEDEELGEIMKKDYNKLAVKDLEVKIKQGKIKV